MYLSDLLIFIEEQSPVIQLFKSTQSLFEEEVFMQLLRFGLLPFLFLVVIILVIILLFNHYVNLEILKRKESVLHATDSILTQLLFFNGGFNQMKLAVEEFQCSVPFTKKWCRELIMERILQMEQNFQLDSATILNLFKLFKFEQITYDLLRHKKWHKRSLGIHQLQFTQDTSKRTQLNAFLKEKNQQIKSNALITLVTFSPEKFGVLKNYEQTLTKADEMKLLDIIYHSTTEMPKSTINLLNSKNTSIVVLGIKLMVLYKIKLSNNQINKLTRLSNFRVRKEAIKAVGKLNLTQANEVLMRQYRIEQHKKIKINILISLKKIGDEKTVKFLEYLLLVERDKDIRFKIVAAILNLNPSFFEVKIQPAIFGRNELQSMARHVKDPLLV